MWYKENEKWIRYISPNFANWLVLKIENVPVDVIASNLEQKTTSLHIDSLLEMSFGTFDKMTYWYILCDEDFDFLHNHSNLVVHCLLIKIIFSCT